MGICHRHLMALSEAKLSVALVLLRCHSIFPLPGGVLAPIFSSISLMNIAQNLQFSCKISEKFITFFWQALNLAAYSEDAI